MAAKAGLTQILPRQGEVAPKATEGEESDAPRKNAEDIITPAGNLWRNKKANRSPPSASGYACHLPLAGEDRNRPIGARPRHAELACPGEGRGFSIHREVGAFA